MGVIAILAIAILGIVHAGDHPSNASASLGPSAPATVTASGEAPGGDRPPSSALPPRSSVRSTECARTSPRVVEGDLSKPFRERVYWPDCNDSGEVR